MQELEAHDSARYGAMLEMGRVWRAEFPSNPDALSCATWMDDVQGYNGNENDIYAFFPWHFRNGVYNPTHLNASEVAPFMTTAHVDLVWALAEVSTAFTKSGAFIQALCLRFLLHMVGDLHQPLHSISRFDAKHTWPSWPGGDRGGNECHPRPVPWNAPSDALNGAPESAAWNASLHKLWDSCGGLFGYDPSSPPTDADNERTLKTAAAMRDAYPRAAFEASGELRWNITQLDQAHWRDDVYMPWYDAAYKLAVEFGYLNGSLDCYGAAPPPDAFLRDVQAVCRRQMALGGYRLAELLGLLLPVSFDYKHDASGAGTGDGDGDVGGGVSGGVVLLVALLCVVIGFGVAALVVRFVPSAFLHRFRREVQPYEHF